MLLERIKGTRVQARRKQPFQASLYTWVGTLVRQYGLDRKFLDRLAAAGEEGVQALGRFEGKREKAYLRPALFFLGSAAEHHLITAIIRTADNPYLSFATAPEEVLLCKALWRQNPQLEAEHLASCHFAALLREEMVGEEGDTIRVKSST